MNAADRRKEIVSILKQEQEPISANKFAKQLDVSRQVIVGDIALLRATGLDIIATPKGYLLNGSLTTNRYIRKIACQHSSNKTQAELYTIVDNGGEILDVIVEHPIYGELSGRLNIASRAEADSFLENIQRKKVNLLSELTDGIHLHTIACDNRENFEKIAKKLNNLGILYSDE